MKIEVYRSTRNHRLWALNILLPDGTGYRVGSDIFPFAAKEATLTADLRDRDHIKDAVEQWEREGFERNSG
jgi:hypothetical protein